MMRDPNMIEKIRGILVLVGASAYGRCNEGGINEDDFELFLAIGGAADEALKAIKADEAASIEEADAIRLASAGVAISASTEVPPDNSGGDEK
jgi:hypothetical protein